MVAKLRTKVDLGGNLWLLCMADHTTKRIPVLLQIGCQTDVSSSLRRFIRQACLAGCEEKVITSDLILWKTGVNLENESQQAHKRVT